VFDADYVPGRAMLKLLAAPFCDPEVGAVMGRVVPFNTGESLLAGLLSLERAAGYQCGQQARYHLGLTALFGGTVGGVRASALRAVGGWDTSSLAEDTDLTCRLNLQGWRVAYVNRAECYEEVPASWRVRRRQLMRWAGGHTECLHRYWLEICRCPFLSRTQKIDAVLMLACYWTAPIMVLGWMASVVLLFAQHPFGGAILSASLAFLGYQLFAGQAAFVELGTAALLDGSGRRILLLPLNLLNFFASTSAICEALLRYYGRRIVGSDGPAWDKTGRSRESNGPGKP
jgi:cellulose synthase/poly-beta-1,6-N-acetylglucosamine synthase-like glycosyltransferase